jgi:hypothetical protein
MFNFSALGKALRRRKAPSDPIEMSSTKTIKFSRGNSALNSR